MLNTDSLLWSESAAHSMARHEISVVESLRELILDLSEPLHLPRPGPMFTADAFSRFFYCVSYMTRLSSNLKQRRKKSSHLVNTKQNFNFTRV